MGEKIFNTMTAVSVDLLALPSPKQTVEQFSVRTKEQVRFVHLFKLSANCRTQMKCSSGICQTRLKKKLRAIHISDVTACDDLKKFIEYIDANSDKNPLIARLDKRFMMKVIDIWIKNRLLFISMMKQMKTLKFLTENLSK